MNKKDTKLKIKNSILKKKNKTLEQKNKELQKELEFMNKIFDNYYSAVSNLRIKTIKGEKIWIDSVSISNKPDLLFQLDKDKEVNDWIKNLNSPYDDNDW